MKWSNRIRIQYVQCIQVVLIEIFSKLNFRCTNYQSGRNKLESSNKNTMLKCVSKMKNSRWVIYSIQVKLPSLTIFSHFSTIQFRFYIIVRQFQVSLFRKMFIIWNWINSYAQQSKAISMIFFIPFYFILCLVFHL